MRRSCARCLAALNRSTGTSSTSLTRSLATTSRSAARVSWSDRTDTGNGAAEFFGEDQGDRSRIQRNTSQHGEHGSPRGRGNGTFAAVSRGMDPGHDRPPRGSAPGTGMAGAVRGRGFGLGNRNGLRPPARDMDDGREQDSSGMSTTRERFGGRSVPRNLERRSPAERRNSSFQDVDPVRPYHPQSDIPKAGLSSGDTEDLPNWAQQHQPPTPRALPSRQKYAPRDDTPSVPRQRHQEPDIQNEEPEAQLPKRRVDKGEEMKLQVRRGLVTLSDAFDPTEPGEEDHLVFRDEEDVDEEFEAVAPGEPEEPVIEVQQELPGPDADILMPWTSLGVPPSIVRKMRAAFPHIDKPTVAQRALFLSAFQGKDVLLRDYMGRGKTMAVSIAALTVAHHITRAPQQFTRGPRIIVLMPSNHLVRQVERDMSVLDPTKSLPSDSISLFSSVYSEGGKSDVSYIPFKRDFPPILITTPKALLEYSELNTSHVEMIIIDEPDSMLPSLPSGRTPINKVRSHPLVRHEPALISVLNRILQIEVTDDIDRKTQLGMVDLLDRRNVQTLWISGTLSSNLKSFLGKRGLVRSEPEPVDLEFTDDATRIQKEARQRAMLIPGQRLSELDEDDTVTLGEDVPRPGQPDHFAITIHSSTGNFKSLTQDQAQKIAQPLISVDKRKADNAQTKKEPITMVPIPEMIDTLVLMHTTSPPPKGHYALVVPPEGTSIDKMVVALEENGVQSVMLTPDLLSDLDLLDKAIRQAAKANDDVEGRTVLIARRAAVPGLHIPRLHTIYLLNGIDIEGMSVGQRRNWNTVRDRASFYDVVSGRVGRLGTWHEERPDGVLGGLEARANQRIVSFVTQGSDDEAALAKVFSQHINVPKSQRRQLKEWDLAELEALMEEVTEKHAQRLDEDDEDF